MHAPRRPLLLALLAGLALTACPAGGEPPRVDPAPALAGLLDPQPPTPTTSPAPEPASPPTAAPIPPPQPVTEPDGTEAVARPAWLGTRVLPLRPDGFGIVHPTPAELRDRRLPPADALPPPPDGEFAATIAAVPEDVAARSTWHPRCPVALDDLRYLTVGFWGFDGRPHTGELLVNTAAAEDLAGVFERLYAARFPIEEMRVVGRDELDLPPTGDGNNTTAFVCRPVVTGAAWSQHAYGLAVDVNPFHNPYVKGDLVLPELASAYVDRTWDRPGMVQPGDAVTAAFAAIGWGWGGSWQSSLDWMHFSASGR